MELTDDARRILQILAHGRSNLHHICQQSQLDESAATRQLTTLSDAGLVTEVDRGLFAVTTEGLASLDTAYPDEAGFLRETTVIHDAPSVKTLRLRGDRGHVEVQVDTESVVEVADMLTQVLADTHGDHDAVTALAALVESHG